ncbi:alpha/beta hydrolase [Streptomyces sp. NPDC020801]|uniref:alpha/beta hydrolase n=1 Tax=Streptomyces sp. NPDC020801 TaxID=3365093 RepID=UPI0037944B85
MDLATLKALDPREFLDATDGYRSTSDMAGAAKDRIENEISVAMRNSLRGEAATAAIGQLSQLGKNFHYIQIECRLVSTTLEAFSYEIEAAKKKLQAAIDGAQAAKLTVNADGSITYPAGGEKDSDGKVPGGGTVSGTSGGLFEGVVAAVSRQSADLDPNPNHRLALDYADEIAGALREATESDEKWAPKVRALKADDDLTVSDKDLADASSDTSGVRDAGKEYLDSLPQPPKNGKPTDNAKWWKGLSPEQQAAWISMRPDSVGALDGLPATVRDEANRTVLSEAHGVAQVKYDAWLKDHPEPPMYQDHINLHTGVKQGKEKNPAWEEWEAERKEMHKGIDGMNAIQRRFDATGTPDATGANKLPEAYLLGFSEAGDGRAIIANGNPDTADHQAVYVPGTTSDLDSIEGNINRMTTLWQTAHPVSDGKSVSTITWLGYDAPDDVVKDATYTHYAYDGAPAFDKFLDGLDASHSGDSAPHRTVIGHSYGSSLVGAAAQTGDLHANDIVFAGSPGVEVSNADQLDVPKGHVWNEYADGDPVPELGRMIHGGGFGREIPADSGFGANQMATDTQGHGGYWNGGSESLKNQALVVVGKYDDVRAAPEPTRPYTPHTVWEK